MRLVDDRKLVKFD